MDGNPQFGQWFAAFKSARPDDSPIGWYDIHELEAAFTAGAVAERMRPLDEILARSHALEAVLHTTPSRKLQEGDVLHLTAKGEIPSTSWTLTGPDGEVIHPADDRPGSVPPAGPVPGQE